MGSPNCSAWSRTHWVAQASTEQLMLLIQHLKSLGLQTYDIRPCLHLVFCTHTNHKLFQNDSHSYIYGLIYSHSLPPSFSLPSPVADMAKLAQETLGCQAELLCGGLGGPNRDRVLQHLITGHPLLIPHPGMTWEGVG